MREERVALVFGSTMHAATVNSRTQARPQLHFKTVGLPAYRSARLAAAQIAEVRTGRQVNVGSEARPVWGKKRRHAGRSETAQLNHSAQLRMPSCNSYRTEYCFLPRHTQINTPTPARPFRTTILLSSKHRIGALLTGTQANNALSPGASLSNHLFSRLKASQKYTPSHDDNVAGQLHAARAVAVTLAAEHEAHRLDLPVLVLASVQCGHPALSDREEGRAADVLDNVVELEPDVCASHKQSHGVP